MSEPITETRETADILDRVRKLLAKAESTDSEAERVALTERATELIAKYGIDRAMLAASDTASDPVVDKTFIIGKPFSEKMMNLMFNIATPLRAKSRTIKRWNPELHGGRTDGGWEYGLRVFAHESDMLRIELLYASLRNQAIAGMKHIKGDPGQKYGQRQKAERESYLDGFVSAIYFRIVAAEKAAQEAREAQQQEERDRAMLEGTVSSGPGVALVLADRKVAVERAFDSAYGITAQDRAEQKARQAKWREKYEQERAQCPRCSKGRPCRAHGTAAGRTSQRVGSRWWDGYDDGQKAHIGDSNAVASSGQKELED